MSQPHYTNGSGMPMGTPYAVEPPAKEGWFAKLDQFKGWITPIVVMLLAGGWLLLPAKERDLKDLAGKVQQMDVRIDKVSQSVDTLANRLEASLEKISSKMDKFQEGQQANREEIIRLSILATNPPPIAVETPPALKAQPARAKAASLPKRKPKIPPTPAPTVQASQKSPREPSFFEKLTQ